MTKHIINNPVVLMVSEENANGNYKYFYDIVFVMFASSPVADFGKASWRCSFYFIRVIGGDTCDPNM